jgi:hypothetical protein
VNSFQDDMTAMRAWMRVGVGALARVSVPE